jgi:hypothetical protein
MKLSMRLALALAIASLTTVSGTALAQPCPSGCGAQVKACMQGGRTSMSACRLDCRTTADPAARRACLHGCREAFRTANGGCRDDLRGCFDSCDPQGSGSGGSSASCLGGCGQDLGTCARGVVTAARSCVSGCASADDKLACVRGCAAAARDGAAGCASAFASCRANCGSPTTTTTLPPASCEDSEAPACGGTCPSANQTCTPVGPTRCACVGASPSGAFLE